MSSGLTSLSQPTFIQCLILHLSHTPTQISYPFFNPQYLFYLIQLSPHFDTQLFFLTPSPLPSHYSRTPFHSLTALSHPTLLFHLTLTPHYLISDPIFTPYFLTSPIITPHFLISLSQTSFPHLTFHTHLSTPSLTSSIHLTLTVNSHNSLSHLTLTFHLTFLTLLSLLTLTPHFFYPTLSLHSLTLFSHPLSPSL